MPAFRSASVTTPAPPVKDEVAVTTVSRLAIRPFVCVSYEEEERFYQPLRVLGAVVLAPSLLAAAKKLPEDEGGLKLLCGAAGLWMAAYNGLRFFEVRTEMDRYLATLDEEE